MSGSVSIPSIKKWAHLGVYVMAIWWAGHACAIDAGSADKKNVGVQKTREYGELSMSLSLTLSPVDSQRKLPAPPVPPGDLQPDMPGDQSRSLGELGAEIEAVEKLIDARQRLLSSAPDGAASVLTKSSVQESPLPISGEAPSGVAGAGSAAESESSLSISAVLADWAEGIGNDGLKAFRKLEDGRSAALVLALLAAAGIVGYLGWKSVRGAKPSRYKTTGGIEGGEKTVSGRAVNVAGASLGDAEQVTSVAGGLSMIEKTIHPPEYGMLEEADIYLRFGHDKLAEEALIEAIKLNPQSPNAYLTLLRIYFSREDRAAFNALGQRLHTLGEKGVWIKAAEMGRALDADNPLYH